VITGKLGLLLAFANPSASPVWAPTGIALAIFLLSSPRYWPAIFVGAFLVNISTAGNVGTSLGIAFGNTLEALVGYSLVQRFANGRAVFERADHVLVFTAAAGIAAALSASIGMFSLWVGGFTALNAIAGAWLTWWLGDLGGALTITPLLILWHEQRTIPWLTSRILETTALLFLVAALGLSVFSPILFSGAIRYPLSFILLLPIMWAAVRFKPWDTVVVVFLLSCISLAGTLNNTGPFAMDDPNMSLTLLQGFMIIASFIGLTLAAALVERRKAEDRLEQNIRERTSDLELAKEQDRMSLLRLRSTIGHLPLAALLLDEKGTIIELNDAYCHTFGINLSAKEAMRIPQSELLARFLESLVYPDNHMKKVHAAIERKEALFGEDILLKNGRIIMRDFLPIHEDGTHRGLLFLYRDVTRERRVDRAKSEFMSLASHQLRTPLTGIRWGLSHLNKHLTSHIDEREQNIILESSRAAGRMAETIETMLKISRIEADTIPLQFHEWDLKKILLRKEELFRSQYMAKNQTLTVDCPDSLSLQTDLTLVREILSNLILNAIKYTPDGGKIFLRGRIENNTAVIEVQDTGYGIPAHQLKSVFQKFFRGDNVVQKETNGNGLGLYLVALLTKALGGSIDLKSREGVGTNFSLRIPTRMSAEEAVLPSQVAQMQRS